MKGSWLLAAALVAAVGMLTAASAVAEVIEPETIYIGEGETLAHDSAWVLESHVTLVFDGGSGTATLAGAPVEVRGHVSVLSGTGVIEADAEFFGDSATMTLAPSSTLDLAGNLTFRGGTYGDGNGRLVQSGPAKYYDTVSITVSEGEIDCLLDEVPAAEVIDTDGHTTTTYVYSPTWGGAWIIIDMGVYRVVAPSWSMDGKVDLIGDVARPGVLDGSPMTLAPAGQIAVTTLGHVNAAVDLQGARYRLEHGQPAIRRRAYCRPRTRHAVATGGRWTYAAEGTKVLVERSREIGLEIFIHTSCLDRASQFCICHLAILEIRCEMIIPARFGDEVLVGSFRHPLLVTCL